ncbi:MAG: hypothetical protein IPM29_20400 [Planctomycetes bacterium]|nr:hypothetical protein [Planctomycetota bacterium]
MVRTRRARRVLCLGHTGEIVGQWDETIRRVWPGADLGVVAAKLDRREYGHAITGASVL